MVTIKNLDDFCSQMLLDQSNEDIESVTHLSVLEAIDVLFIKIKKTTESIGFPVLDVNSVKILKGIANSYETLFVQTVLNFDIYEYESYESKKTALEKIPEEVQQLLELFDFVSKVTEDKEEHAKSFINVNEK